MKKSFVYIVISVLLLVCGCSAAIQNEEKDKSSCANCGAGVHLNDEFCSSCGTSLKQPTEPKHVHNYSEASCTECSKCTCGLTIGQELGHNYVEGICSRCGKKESGYKSVYSYGDVWIVEDQWEFTINSVTTHTLCNSYANEKYSYSDEQVVTIEYTYKNIGYNDVYGLPDDLYISASSFYVYDETKATTEMYLCTHNKSPKACIADTSCVAQESFVLSNNSSQITLVVKLRYYTANGRSVEVRANFELPINETTN